MMHLCKVVFACCSAHDLKSRHCFVLTTVVTLELCQLKKKAKKNSCMNCFLTMIIITGSLLFLGIRRAE